MKKTIKLILADDYPMFREGLKLLLEKEEQVTIIGEASNGEEVLELVRKEKPDIVITDMQMPRMDGIELTKTLMQEHPEICILALTMFNEDRMIIEMLEAGAKGYLLKNTSKEELMDAIHSVETGGSYYCNATTLKLTKMIARSKANPFRPPDSQQLTQKEIEVIELVCQEYSSKQIAPLLGHTLKTIENYRHSILEKTGAKNMIGVVVFAIKNGIYKP